MYFNCGGENAPFYFADMIYKYTVNTPYPVGPVHFYLKSYPNYDVLFDTGPHTNEAREFLRNTINLSRLKYTFVTHCHADHYGLIDYIYNNSDSKIIISKQDYLRFERFDHRKRCFLNLLKEYGFTKPEIAAIELVLIKFKDEVPMPKDISILEESKDIIEELQISYIPCPGHSQSDIVYLIDNYAISGDVVLRDIFQTPLLDIDISNFSDRFQNYREFCKTIEKLKGIENFTFLPGHRDFIDSVDERIIYYLTKLVARASVIKDDLKYKGILFVLRNLVGDLTQNPLKVYLKLSEIVFINDFLSEPEILISTLEKLNLWDRLKDKIGEII